MADLSPEQMVSNYIRLRDHKAEADAEFKKSMTRVNDGMKKLESLMLKHLNDTGGTSLACKGTGTCYINTKYTATVSERETFLNHVVENNLWEALDVKANKKYIREAAADGTVIPGVKLSSIQIVGVRRA